MYYTIDVTRPTRVQSIETYKKRNKEIVFGQLRNTFLKEKFQTFFFWLLCVFIVPFMLVYSLLCLLEIVVNTILLPISLVPYLRGITLVIQALIWGLEVAIGYFSLTPQTYENV